MAVQVPLYFEPRPYQRRAWARRLSGRYHYDVDIWHRQSGKDTSDIQYGLFNGYMKPGTQSVYVGLDNKWIRRNIWDKYLDGRTHFDSYPKWDQSHSSGILETLDTKQQVKFHNNPSDLAPAIIQYLGFKENESAIGSSYDNFYISEYSLYKRGTFDLIMPIWDMKKAEGKDFLITLNFTPRGMSNIAVDFLSAYTGTADPEGWPGEHGDVYVDVMPANKSVKNDGTRLFTDEMLEEIRQRYIRALGNDLLFRQEYMCEFLAVNAGLVFPGIEAVRKEKRYHPFNLDTSRPVYIAWDISSKDKETDWTSCVVFQYYNNYMLIYDYFEDNRKAVVECVSELARRPYFHLIRAACLPWDSDRSGSSSSPLEECRRAFPNIQWYKLDRTYVSDRINRGRQMLANSVINEDKCDWLMECFESWEYRELSSVDDWAAKPKHDRYSHLMDAYGYACDFLAQVSYLQEATGRPPKMPSYYDSWNLGEGEREWEDLPPGMRPSVFSPLRKKSPNDIYGDDV